MATRNKQKLFSLSEIRKTHYSGQRKKKALTWYMDDWYNSPYSALKSRYYIETSSIIVFILHHTRITPNFLTLAYVFFGAISGVFLASNNNNLILIGLFLLFSKGSIDWADGLLARIKKQTSHLGDLLDNWGALVGSYSYLCGFGIYLFNKSGEGHFVIISIIIILVKSLDIKNYAYQLSMYNIFYSNKKNKIFQNIGYGKKKSKYKVSRQLILLKYFFQNFLDERSRTIDFICLLIFIDIFFIDVILLNYIYYLIFIKIVALFCGSFYITYFKNFFYKKVK